MPAHELVFTAGAFAALTRRLAAGDGRAEVPCALARLADRWDWLVADLSRDPAQATVLVAVRATHPEVLAEAVAVTAAEPASGSRVVLGVGTGPAAGHLAGVVQTTRVVEPLRAVRVIAPGMPRVNLVGRTDHPAALDRERFSRTIGALGEAAFARLRSLRFAVVGCGRLGSLVADHLAGYGVAGLTLIDHDVVERHNLGEMVSVTDDAIGRLKADALAEALRHARPAAPVTSVPVPIQSLNALFAAKEADVIVCCPDNPEARLVTARLAALYLKPVLDIGTGIVRGPAGRGTGLDVRWLLPGRCVACGDTDFTTPMRGVERLGSLRSLNTCAVGLGFTLLERFLRGELWGSVWLQGEIGTDGVPRFTPGTRPVDRRCHICGQAGAGDRGLSPTVAQPSRRTAAR